MLQGGGLKIQAHFLGDDGTAGEDGDILQHGLATVAEARRLTGRHFNDTAHVVDDQGCQCFAFDVLGNDNQRLGGLGYLLQQGQQLTDIGNLLLHQQDIRIFLVRAHALLVVDEVGRQVAAVELHTFNHVQFVFQTGTFLDGDNAFLADLVHRIGDDVTHSGIAVGGNGAYLGDCLVVRAGSGHLLDFFYCCSDGLVDAALEVHRVHARSDGLEAFVQDRLGQHGRSGGTVTRLVGGL